MHNALAVAVGQLVAIAYTIGFLALASYWVKVLLITASYLVVRHRDETPPPLADRPVVTVQLPIYNERYVAARVIDAACRMRWPADRLEIQVLDDSTDDTRTVVDDAARAWRSRGVDITVVRREDRSGYKAGALAHGLSKARGSLIAVFDADFVPTPDFIERTAPHLTAGIAAVQTRWGHLNRDLSGLTRAQALALDGHFIVEQTTRSRCHLLLNFNGTGGVWRREAIDDAGGWQHDTLSEDVDLSYRAQLRGWRIVFLRDVVVPGELPESLPAFKRQQRRWATGTTQVLRKLGPRILRSDLPAMVKLHALLSLSSHLVHPVSLAMFLMAPLMLVYQPALHTLVGILTIVSLSPPLMLAVAATESGKAGLRRLKSYPLLALLAVGMSLNGTVAVARGLRTRGGEFERTPKSGKPASIDSTRRLESAPTSPSASQHIGTERRLAAASEIPRPSYHLGSDRWALAEAALAVYAWVGFLAALWMGSIGLALFMGMFASGYTLTARLSYDRPLRRPSVTRRRVRAGEP